MKIMKTGQQGRRIMDNYSMYKNIGSYVFPKYSPRLTPDLYDRQPEWCATTVMHTQNHANTTRENT